MKMRAYPTFKIYPQINAHRLPNLAAFSLREPFSRQIVPSR